jgi:hypothetical protein
MAAILVAPIVLMNSVIAFTSQPSGMGPQRAVGATAKIRLSFLFEKGEAMIAASCSRRQNLPVKT